MKYPGLTRGLPLKLLTWDTHAAGGMCGVAVKCIDITQNTDCEGILKLKGIDGGPHKRRNMWFNSMIREEPYPGSNGCRIRERFRSLRTAVEVLHGCRQLVP